MAALPFVGPSYQLATKKAAVDRAVNLYLVGMETPGKAPFILDSIPGLVTFANLGAEVRGGITVGARAFVVAGATLFEINADGTFSNRGTLATSTGPVDMAYGLFQLVVVDGPNGYVLTTASNAFQQITSDGFYGSKTVGFADNFFIFIHPDTGQFYISAINDATSDDPLDFASAESNPDNLIAIVVSHEELVLFGEVTAEVWFNSGAQDFPYQRNRGVTLEVGCLAPYSAQKIDSSVIWIGRDENGAGMVYQFVGAQARIISTVAVTQALQKSTDLTQARAYCYQDGKLTFWCVNAPGLTTTWGYEIGSASWHERADLDSFGQYMPHRGTCHLFAFGYHLLGSDEGRLYRMDSKTYTNDGDPLVRERISPHAVDKFRDWATEDRFVLDCTTGEAGQGIETFVEYSFSNDSGAKWSDPQLRSPGLVGERIASCVWRRGGLFKDRVRKIRFSGNAPFSIIDAQPEISQ